MWRVCMGELTGVEEEQTSYLNWVPGLPEVSFYVTLKTHFIHLTTAAKLLMCFHVKYQTIILNRISQAHGNKFTLTDKVGNNSIAQLEPRHNIQHKNTTAYVSSCQVFLIFQLHPNWIVWRQSHWIHNHHSPSELVQCIFHHLQINTHIGLNLFLKNRQGSWIIFYIHTHVDTHRGIWRKTLLHSDFKSLSVGYSNTAVYTDIRHTNIHIYVKYFLSCAGCT